jgi:hypothetical protein
MSNQSTHANALRRNAAWTHYKSGSLELRPTKTTHRAGYLDASRDFEAQSFHPVPKLGKAVPAWSPGYVAQENGDETKIGADLIALTMDGVSANQAYRWLVAEDLAGLTWPTIADSPTRPTCCLVLLLDRTVNQHDYKLIWAKLARETVGDQFAPEQADPRHRFDYPRTPTNDSQLLRYDGQALPASYALSLGAISGESIAPNTATRASDIQAK